MSEELFTGEIGLGDSVRIPSMTLRKSLGIDSKAGSSDKPRSSAFLDTCLSRAQAAAATLARERTLSYAGRSADSQRQQLSKTIAGEFARHERKRAGKSAARQASYQ